MSFDLDRVVQQFAADGKVKTVFILLVVDFVLGVCAALASGKFRLSYIGDFLKRDLLGKIIPWFALYAAGKATTEEPIPGIDFSKLADGAFALIVAALVGSILKSVAELGLKATSNPDLERVLEGDPQTSGLARALVAPEEVTPSRTP